MLVKKNFEDLSKNISLVIEKAQKRVVKTINQELVKRNWEIGKNIVEFEQKGKERAEYGAETLKTLSKDLTKKYGRGFAVDNLELFRRFYSTFLKSEPLARKLTWTNISILLKIKDESKRNFYMIECEKNNWSKRELERQIKSQLYDRLLMSKDEAKVLEMSKKGQIIEKPSDVIKDPIVLEFLDLKDDPSYSESDVEQEIINKLQDFIMELGKGFSFVGRQYKIRVNDTDYFADLVFYNKFLQCSVIIELKVGKLKPEHLGQLQFYVGYFNKYEKADHENNAIGILVCEEKDDAVVKITLPEDNKNIFAVEYKKYLPSEKEIQKKVTEVIKKYN